MLQCEPFFTQVLLQQDRDVSFGRLVERNACNDVFGDNFSIMALSILIGRPIYSFTPYGSLVSNQCLNEEELLRFPVKIFLYNFHFSAILPFNRFVNTGDIPLTINGLKLRTSIKRKIEEVDEVL